MEYLVMECGLSYAVVLDSKGRFLKVPNLGYEVGQVLDCVVLPDLSSQRQARRRRITRWAVMAACLCLMVLGGWGFWQAPVGTVRMQINPDVQMSVNRFDRVIGLEGLNQDGEALIEAYHSYGKPIGTVSDDLADRAMEMGFLRDDGQITLTVESNRENWRSATEEKLLLELDTHLDHRVTVVTASESPSDQPTNPPETIIIEPDKLLPNQTESDDPQEVTTPGKDWDDDDDDDAPQDNDDDNEPQDDDDDDDPQNGDDDDDNNDDDDDDDDDDHQDYDDDDQDDDN